MKPRAFDPNRGHFRPRKRKEQGVMRPGKTADDHLPVEQRARVQAYQARCGA